MGIGSITVVGIGPGNPDDLTPRAREALAQAEAVVGYALYIELVASLVTGKEIHDSGMTQELERCRLCLELARAGKRVVLVSGGDAGIYGMAGPMIEVAAQANPPLLVTVVPGISALIAAAALLGAPLMHDFAVISLSDRLTPWPLIEKRVQLAAAADLVIILYNPKSNGRPHYLAQATALITGERAPATPVGIVRQAGRAEEQATLTDLAGLPTAEVDMFSVVLIGNSQTKIINGRMVTPRGYPV